jgi:hypothetical protein
VSLAASLILLTCLSDAFTCADSTACRVCAQERRETGAEASYDAAGERVDLLLRDKHDKMDEMFKVMVPMSTSQSNRTSPETSPKPPSAGPR